MNMPKFAANLSMLYPELDFLDRFEAAARDGFKGVEYLFPYAFDKHELAARIKDNGLEQVLFNSPPGDWDKGERGFGCHPGRKAEFQKSIELALSYAEVINCSRLHVMAGLIPIGHDRLALSKAYVDQLRWAAKLAAQQGVDILIEPINSRDIPIFFLNRQDQAHDFLLQVDEKNLKVQMDLYHCQIVEGDVATKIKQYLPTGRVGHIQIAGVPERHEPSLGELNYPYLFTLMDKLDYSGWIGCEYRPELGLKVGGTSAGLNWLKPYLN